ncbi:MAG: FHA domain-containing serine/threonine-protein kinase [Anaerolineales bacterium]|jgi:serine/threonine protein kinase
MEEFQKFIGKKIGAYEILDFLGNGAMAHVYKARHSQLNRFVALKLLHNRYTSDPDFVQQFTEEAQNLAQLRHPNIVQIYDADISGEYPYLAMEFIDGLTLKLIIKGYREKFTRVSLVRSLRIIYSIGLALSYAHQRGVIHRDVKPSNVLFENSGRVVLADFGLARLLSHKKESETGMIIGTPAYMSPEQALGQTCGPSSDLYSLAVISYELLTGEVPFIEDNPLAIAMKHVSEAPVPPRSIVPEIPVEVEKVVIRSMAKNPNERYSTINEFLHDLTKVRLRIKTARLATASLTSLKDAGGDVKSWTAPARPKDQDGANVCIHFVDTGQIMNLEMQKEYTIGRKHKSQSVIPDIDLSLFNAYDWGISRLHASIIARPDSVSISDIGSSNGTWVDGKRLPPNQPAQLKHGDIFYLGKLKIQLLNYES